MLFKCSLCSYETDKYYNLKRHQTSIHIENNDDVEYIYLLQEREFVKTNENIYKIGKTKQKNLKRIGNYPNGTILVFQIKCIDCDMNEKIILNKFKEHFIHNKDIGLEYFTGDENKMIDIIYNIVKVNNKAEIEDSLECIKCNKILSSKNYLQKHLIICKGVSNSLECHFCHKIFSSTSSKSHHLKICKNNTMDLS